MNGKIRNRNRTRFGGSSGFSMIDVMIAVVVLATGMLAMAALQAGLTRNAAETRSRSNAVSIANGVLDAVRAIADRGTPEYSALTGAGATGTWKASVDALEGNTNLTAPPAATYGDAFTVGVVVQRYLSERVPANCGGAASTPCFRAVANGTSDTPEFKRVEATVTWTDAAGQDQSITLSDVLSAVPSSNSRLLVARPVTPGSTSGGPRVQINVPTEQGIIPIAVGTDEYGRDRSTAATNPKPLRDQTTGSAGTRFDVLTYAGVTDTTAEIQRRVETQVLTCECRFGAPPVELATDRAAGTTSFFQTKLRPTFWSGSRYVAPETVVKAAMITDDAWGTSASQSPLCNDCCRDHHDPAGGVPAEKPAVSPYRSAHNHFDRVGAALNAAAPPSAVYDEACRLIRADGFWRVATDLRLEHTAFLQTDRTAKDFVPAPAATVLYSTFVKNYLQQRVIPTASGGTPSDSLDDPLDVPAFIPMATISGEKRFLHTRALYLDYLLPNTRTFLESKLTNCTASPQIECLLPFLPLVGVNATEVGRYARTPVSPATLTVTAGTINLDTTQPDGGVMRPVTGPGGATAGESAFALVEMARENTGLTDGGSTVNPLDSPISSSDPNFKRTDSQEVRFQADAGADTDGDGIENTLDNCVSIVNPDQLNTDGDAFGNACDNDDDGDAIADSVDSCPLIVNTGRDTDGDGIDDACDTTDDDQDDDGVQDRSDNCPTVPNPGQEDVLAPLTGGRIGDACDDRDSDNDGVRDGADNCPSVANPDQADNNGFRDGDGIGDACEFVDRDGDGIEDSRDNCPADPNANQADSDGDGIGDVCDAFAPIQVGVTVNVAGVNMTTVSPKPNVGWSINPTVNLCQPASAAANSTPNPYSCDGISSANITLSIGRYNRLVSSGSNAEEVTNPCRNVLPSPAPNGPAKVFPATCYNYRLATATVTGGGAANVGTSGTTGTGVNEISQLALTGLTEASVVVTNFTLQDATSAISTSQYTCNSFNEPTINASFCQ